MFFALLHSHCIMFVSTTLLLSAYYVHCIIHTHAHTHYTHTHTCTKHTHNIHTHKSHIHMHTHIHHHIHTDHVGRKIYASN